MKHIITVLLVLTCSLTTTYSKTGHISVRSIKPYINSLVKQYDSENSPALSVSVVYKGRPIYTETVGHASLELDVDANNSTAYNVGSLAKQVTAMCILLLEQSGRLSVSDDIRKYLPELPRFSKVIIIDHLLHHTSGIRSYIDLLRRAGWDYEDVFTNEQVLQMISMQKNLNHDPGKKFSYSNSGYFLLARIVERVSGMTFADYTMKHIFRPLGMKNSGFHDDRNRLIKGLAESYEWRNGEFQKQSLVMESIGATGLYTTIDDWTRWMQNSWYCRIGGRSGRKRVLSRSRRENGDPVAYGYGLFLWKKKGLQVASHNGVIGGYRGEHLSFPGEGLSITVLSASGNRATYSLALKIADYILDEQLIDSKNRELNTADRDNPDYDKFVGYYRLSKSYIIQITEGQGTLMAKGTGQPRLPLKPRTSYRFRYEDLNAEIRFKRDRNRGGYMLVLYQHGRKYSGKKISKLEALNVRLKDYQGRYYCAEIDTFYTVKVNRDWLVVSHIRVPSQNYYVRRKDYFRSGGLHMAFKRDKKKQVSGFFLSSGRSKNLWFTRLDSDTLKRLEAGPPE
jgi:CubicO group peptidase (beta-lactamase class C family)